MTQEAAPQPALEAAARELHENYHGAFSPPWDSLHESERATWRREAEGFLTRHYSAAQQKVPETEEIAVETVTLDWAASAKPQPPETGGQYAAIFAEADKTGERPDDYSKLQLLGIILMLSSSFRAELASQENLTERLTKRAATIRAETVAHAVSETRHYLGDDHPLIDAIRALTPGAAPLTKGA